MTTTRHRRRSRRSPPPGRSTIFQPVAGWASTADSTPASEPWSAWNAGQTPADPVSASPPASLDVEAGVAGGALSRDPAADGVGIGGRARTLGWRGSTVATRARRRPARFRHRAARSACQPGVGLDVAARGPRPRRMGIPELAANLQHGSSSSSGVESYPATGGAAMRRHRHRAQRPGGRPVSTPSAPAPKGPNGWEPAPGDFHDPWRDLPQPGVVSEPARRCAAAQAPLHPRGRRPPGRARRRLLAGFQAP